MDWDRFDRWIGNRGGVMGRIILLIIVLSFTVLPLVFILMR
jgi:hypothetical protein